MQRHLAVAAAALALLGAQGAAAQTTHTDPQNRFTIDLPTGLAAESDQLDRIYVFAKSGRKLMLVVTPDAGDRDAAWASTLGLFLNKTVTAPPADAVFDVDVNGNPARWAIYGVDADAGGGKKVKITVYFGVVVLEGTGNAVSFFSVLNEKLVKSEGEATVQSFNSIRVPGAPLTGAKGRVPATVKAVAKPEAAAPVVEAPASTFEHPLVSLNIPAGWTAERREGSQIVAINHPVYGMVVVAGLEKNKFGKNRDDIYKVFVQALQNQMPSSQQSRAPYEVATSAGAAAQVGEFTSEIVAAGQSRATWGFVAAFKDSRRGLGFMWVQVQGDRETALKDVISILKSLR